MARSNVVISGEQKVYCNGLREMSAAQAVGLLVGSPMHFGLAAAGLVTGGVVRSGGSIEYQH